MIKSLSKIVLVFVIAIGMLAFHSPAKAASYKGFVVIKTYGYDKVLVNDGYSSYLVQYGFGCSSWNMTAGSTIYIDTYLAPSILNKIYVPGGYTSSTCSVYSSKTIRNLKYYSVLETIDNKDSIIVMDVRGDKYFVEYGIGCSLSMWRYEGKIIAVDIGGSLLDGIGDTIYLLDDGRDCKVWGAQSLRSVTAPVYTSPTYSSPTYTTPTAGSTFTKQLQKGSTGTDVTNLQNVLIQKGFLKANKIKKKGTFDSATKSALMKYQKSVGLPKSGILDKATRNKLNS